MNKTVMLIQTTIFVLYCIAGSIMLIIGNATYETIHIPGSFYLWYFPTAIGLGLAVKEASTPAAAYATIEGGP